MEFVKKKKKKKTLLDQLQNWGLIPLQKNCFFRMVLINYEENGWNWKCNNKTLRRKQKVTKCHTKVSINKGSFFNQSRISYFQALSFAHLWSEGLNLRQI